MIRTAYRSRILEGLAAALRGPSALRAIVRTHVGVADPDGGADDAAGKLLRSSLVMFVGEELRAEPERCLHAATALELVHNFSLVHDDIQDRDRTRRGRPTVWSLYGVAEAINAGDLLHSLAQAEGLRAGAAPAARLADAATEMIEGQSTDLQFEDCWVGLDEYLGMIDRKTGALLRCAFVLGAIVAGADARVVEALDKAGEMAGRAFQIRDDLLGIWGDGDVLGKPLGSDIRRRKRAYPAVLAYASASHREKKDLAGIYLRDAVSEKDVAWTMALMDRLGVAESGDEAVADYVRSAVAALEPVPLSEKGREAMMSLLEYLTRRAR